MKIFSITGTRIIIENDKNELITATGHKTFEGFCIEKDNFECLKPMLKTLAEYEKIELIRGIKNDKISPINRLVQRL
jgi:hypothetical protein